MASNDPRRNVAQANPYNPLWIAEHLAPMADRAAAGEQSSLLSRQLLESLWPWALQTADRWASVVPPEADRNGVRSEVLWEVYQATQRIEWPRYQSWPALLKARIRGGFTAAARAEDPLTRGQRRARQRYLTCVERRTQHLGRQLTSNELSALAEALGPQDSIVAVMAGRSMITSLPADETYHSYPTEPPETPESAVLRHATRQGLRSWIGEDLPQPLALWLAALLREPQADIRLSARDRRRLERYLPALLERIAG